MLYKVGNVPTAFNFLREKKVLREKIMSIYPRARCVLRAGGLSGLSRAPREQPKENPKGIIQAESISSPGSVW